MMKKMLLAAAAVMSVACGPEIQEKSYNAGINIIPVPVECTIVDSAVFTLTPETVIVVETPDFINPASYLASKIKAATGFDQPMAEVAPDSNYISIRLNTRIPAGMEGYILNSSKDRVVIEARTPQGAFYGVQTLLQLLPAEIESPTKIDYVEWTIPSVAIVDEPRFAYRGLMLDVARHFMSVEGVKKQLDVLSMFKINRFHWHLTEDQGWRIEIKKYPKLIQEGATRDNGDGTQYGPLFYTQDQIREVVAYAAERYIEVIPEIELPGHGLAALAAYPEFSCTGGPFKPRNIWGIEEDVYCVGKESTFQFWEDVISEVIELFPSQYFHIGGDECPKNRWKQCADCQARAKALGLKEKVEKLKDREVKHSVEEQLQSYAIKRVADFLASKGKKMIGWDEILEGGLAEGAVVMSWRGTQGGIDAARLGNDVIMTPGSGGMYIDHYQGASEVEPMAIGGHATLSKTYSFEPIPSELDSSQRQYIKGAQVNMWSEYLTSEAQAEYMIYPRVLALAELTWSPVSRKDFDDFARRVDNAYVRLDFHKINYHVPMPEGVLTQNVVFTGDTATLEFTNTRNYPMVYTLDGEQPTAQSDRYVGPIKITQDANLRIATLLASDRTSKTREIPVLKQTFAPAVVDKYDPDLQGGGEPLDATSALSELITGKAGAGNMWTGKFTVEADDIYVFATDMNELYIDGELLIDNNTGASRHRNKKVQKALAKGDHHYTLVFLDRIQDGFPQRWNATNFVYKPVSAGSYITVKPEDK